MNAWWQKILIVFSFLAGRRSGVAQQVAADQGMTLHVLAAESTEDAVPDTAADVIKRQEEGGPGWDTKG
jgi:hypothetical protein